MTDLGGKAVYVVDDDREVLASTAFLLPTLGYECAVFAGAQEFLGRAAELPPGCVLTDLRMPAMDGFDLASRISELGLGWPILMMTSEYGADVERRAAEHGIEVVLHKPVDADLLADALADAFARIARFAA
jgi:FixJ family two-component response regulator